MNISQHAFVPRGRFLSGYYSYSSSPQLNSSSGIITTELQRGDTYNCAHFFGAFQPVGGTWYATRLYYPTTQGSSYSGVGLSDLGYAAPQLKLNMNNFTSMAFNCSSSYYANGCPVLVVLWRQKYFTGNRSLPELETDDELKNVK